MEPESCKLHIHWYDQGQTFINIVAGFSISIPSGLKKLVRGIHIVLVNGSADLSEAHEKRSLAFTTHPTSLHKPCLQFPPFHQHTLMQNSWDACDPNGRIRIMLSEQLVSKTSSPGQVDLGITNGIVCFSFQHAPKGLQHHFCLLSNSNEQ